MTQENKYSFGVVFEKENLGVYLGVREFQWEDGTRGVIIIKKGSDSDVVYAAIKNDQAKNPGARYHFFRPTQTSTDRQGLLIGELQ